ncbi:MAG: phosphate transport system regulatory protein PhoU [Gammaproteobacteria bacterium RIFOXYA12_FULL_61_12]|nr:MAG: phosphate transport system regulatory protein PhoU [Gammaproteobacteria bacterium RIFOXYD12_FULL_61_37]OGT94214.1 MAG: phosphate transport system regulatory protein PhoU [Gammaproteobacteria bacterium RIFOXYA12_FULL_61_12]
MTDKLGEGHILSRYDKEIMQLRGLMLEMGAAVLEQLKEAVAAMEARDVEMARKVIYRERHIHDLDMTANEECIKHLAMRSPVASDLRLVISLSKCISDLERIGDEARKIAHTTLRLFDQGPGAARPALLYDVSVLAEKAIRMLVNAVHVIEREDLELAIHVIQSDAELDRLFKDSLRRLSTFLLEDPRHIGAAIDIIFVLKALERIGDHAENVCAHMIYAVKGKDPRFIKKDHLSVGFLEG